MIKFKFNIRAQLIVTILLSLIASIIVIALLNVVTRSAYRVTFTSYQPSKDLVEDRLAYLLAELPERINAYSLQAAVDEASDGKVDIYVADESGKVLFHSAEAAKRQLGIMGYYADRSDDTEDYEGKPYALIDAGEWSGKTVFLVAEGRLKGEPGYYIKEQPLKNVMLFLLVFIVCFYWFTSRKTRKIQQINRQLGEIASGDLNVRLSTRDRDELGIVSKNINAMAESLQRQLTKERKLEQSKMELITGVSHDLRTPLTSIVGYLDLLRSKAYQDEAEHDQFVKNTYSKTMQLKKLIDDLFEYTRLGSGDIELKRQRIEMTELLRQLASEYEPIALDRGIAIKTELSEAALPAQVDGEKIVRALDNLLMNAIKFSIVPGDILVRAAAVRDGEGIAVEVENQGRPITPEQEEQLFDRFYKTDAARGAGSRNDGSGLGLSIAKQIAELHGGTISLHHDRGRYTFRLELPGADEANG
ncbi:HAMP domain-containing sensor histidine kinase [Paenibacillus glycinis]|uniref:histidine kinase n=1 Tax=Paenibacillus glycinis TaxID=2697035 RepID=A0ABW9XWA3_9BACL|nr:HAMP domain-containing sensor histidine kinase [Paenibacillus glycinis]NBD26971.1 HAMP domain-containing protein [Paenibacillus glycinis]